MTPSEPGAVRHEGDRSTLEFRRRLPRPPEAVWRALTDPTELSRWYLAKARVEGRPGGSVELEAGPSQFHVVGRILAWDPPRLFEHEWKVERRPELPEGEDAVIRWELRPDGDGTLLHLTHTRLTRRTAVGFAPGTHAFLDRLEAQLLGEPLPSWPERYAAAQPQYPERMGP